MAQRSAASQWRARRRRREPLLGRRRPSHSFKVLRRGPICTALRPLPPSQHMTRLRSRRRMRRRSKRSAAMFLSPLMVLLLASWVAASVRGRPLLLGEEPVAIRAASSASGGGHLFPPKASEPRRTHTSSSSNGSTLPSLYVAASLPPATPTRTITNATSVTTMGWRRLQHRRTPSWTILSSSRRGD